MKYLAALIILIAMGWTWSLTTSSPALSLEQHKALEAQVQAIITQHVRAKRPAATDVTFKQLFTETVKPGSKLRASFRYEISEPTSDGDVTSQSFEGEVNLASRDGGKNWEWAGENVHSPGVEFQKGLTIRPDQPATKPETKPESKR